MKRRFAVLLGFALVAALAGSALAEPVTAIRDPRPAGWVVDLTNTVKPETVAALNKLGGEVKTQTAGELMVVVIRTTGGMDVQRYADEVFRTLKIGDPVKANGVLLLVALDDRVAKVILGDGVDSDAEVRIADRIMAEDVVAAFKEGDPSGGLFLGALSLAEQILKARPSAGGASLEGAGAVPAAPPGAAKPPAKDAGKGGSSGLGIVGLVIGGIVVLVIGGAVYKAKQRSKPRPCPQCGMPMVRLSEQADDQHLSAGERMEEQMRGADYDVWHCARCNQTIKLRYGGSASGVEKCPKCGFQTMAVTTTTMQAATQQSEGVARVDEVCRNCPHRNTYTKTLPKLASGQQPPSGGGTTSGRGATGRW